MYPLLSLRNGPNTHLAKEVKTINSCIASAFYPTLLSYHTKPRLLTFTLMKTLSLIDTMTCLWSLLSQSHWSWPADMRPCSNSINSLWTGWWVDEMGMAAAKDTDDANKVLPKNNSWGTGPVSPVITERNVFIYFPEMWPLVPYAGHSAQLRNDLLKVRCLLEALGLEIEHAFLLLMESHIVVWY